MTDRDRLIELIRKSNCVSGWDYDIDDFKDPDPILQLTDYLLANGVIRVVRCKDCKHRTNKGICEKFRQRYPFFPEDDFYCNFGELKEREGK